MRFCGVGNKQGAPVPAVSTFTSTTDPLLNGVLSGIKWATGSLTFSFPSSGSLYGAYGSSNEPTTGFEALTAAQQTATRAVLQMYSAVANVTFTEVTETSSVHGDLRYAESDAPSTAWAYYPSTSPLGGDIWFNNSKNYYDNPLVGTYAFQTLLHETGHAMGLKHPQDAKGSFAAMPANYDSLEYTVMSYRSYIGAPLTGYTAGSSSYPQTLMMYDIAALQFMYGANYTTNAGSTTYTWSTSTGQMSINGVGQGAPAGNKIFMTIWDGGGVDTYDFSNYATGVTVNLQPGSWTTASTTQLASLGGGHYAAGNIANALLYNNNTASLIENAVGGSAIDKLTGNVANNSLKGGAGNDVLDGAAGSDIAVYSGMFSNYSIVQNADGSWQVVDLRSGSPDGSDKLWNIELLQFSDSLETVGGQTAAAARRAAVTALKLGAGDRHGYGHGRCDRVGRQIDEGNREHAAHRYGGGDLYGCECARHAYGFVRGARHGLSWNLLAQHDGDRFRRQGHLVVLGLRQRHRPPERRADAHAALRRDDRRWPWRHRRADDHDHHQRCVGRCGAHEKSAR